MYFIIYAKEKDEIIVWTNFKGENVINPNYIYISIRVDKYQSITDTNICMHTRKGNLR